MNSASKSSHNRVVRAIVNGLKKYCTKDKQHVSINGVTCSITELVERMEAYIAFLDHAATYEPRGESTVTERPSYPSLCSFVADQFGEDSRLLHELGHHPRRIARRTEALTARAATRAAWRAAKRRRIESLTSLPSHA